MCSNLITSLAELNFRNRPESTLAAPITSTGALACGPQAAISSKSICLRNNAEKSEYSGRIPRLLPRPLIAFIIGDAGLVWKEGSIPRLIMRMPLISASFSIFSVWLCAVLSCQKSIRRCQIGRSPRRRAYHTSVAQRAPPEVPLMLTNSNSSCNLAWQIAFRTPAVKAVWLPPPWQAIAIFVFKLSPPLTRIQAITIQHRIGLASIRLGLRALLAIARSGIK